MAPVNQAAKTRLRQQPVGAARHRVSPHPTTARPGNPTGPETGHRVAARGFPNPAACRSGHTVLVGHISPWAAFPPLARWCAAPANHFKPPPTGALRRSVTNCQYMAGALRLGCPRRDSNPQHPGLGNPSPSIWATWAKDRGRARGGALTPPHACKESGA